MAVAKKHSKSAIRAENKKHLPYDIGINILGGLLSSLMAAGIAIPVSLGWQFAHYIVDYHGWAVPLLSWFNGLQAFALIMIGVAIYSSQHEIRQTLSVYHSYQKKGTRTYFPASGSKVKNVIAGISVTIFFLPLLAGAIALALAILINCLFGWTWSVFLSQLITLAIPVYIIGIPFVMHAYLYKDEYGTTGANPSYTAGFSMVPRVTVPMPSSSPSAISTPTPSSSASPSTGAKQGTSYRNDTDMFGNPIVRGSNGTTYTPTTDMYGAPIMKGSDGTTIRPDTDMYGTPIQRSSSGVTYTNTTDGRGDPIIQGSDGSKYKSERDMWGDEKLTKIK